MSQPSAYRLLASLLIPPRCAACASQCTATATLCGGCERQLASARPGSSALAGVGRVFWAAPYEGAARDLVAALKFAGRLALAERAASAVLSALPPELGPRAVVPVPAAPWRRRRRGFDPAESIAAAVAKRLDLPFEPILRRRQGPRQVGKRRRDRIGSPPKVRAASCPPHPALLIDDVLTTGATLRACAQALRAVGAGELHAAVFARALGAGAISS